MRKRKTPKGSPRPSDAELARRLHGTGGRLYVRAGGGRWRDTETGAVGTLAELAEAWTAEPRAVP